MTPDTDAPAETLHYTLFAVFRRDPHPLSAAAGAPALADVASGLASVRGIYDVSGLRADADVMLWLTGHTADGLQADLRALRRSRELSVLLPTWNAMGVHRTAEFARDHVPAYARGLPPKQWLTIYPFVRSYEWYLLPDAERGAMLREHGLLGRDFPQVQANTVASFALGDYEWLLPMESDDVVDLVDMMRHLRATDARRHVREEIPFFTGRLIPATEVAEVLA